MIVERTRIECTSKSSFLFMEVIDGLSKTETDNVYLVDFTIGSKYDSPQTWSQIQASGPTDASRNWWIDLEDL